MKKNKLDMTWPGLIGYTDRLEEVNAKLVEALEDVIPELKGLVVDSGGCDHSAGICWCELIRKINRATEVLKLAKGE